MAFIARLAFLILGSALSFSALCRGGGGGGGNSHTSSSHVSGDSHAVGSYTTKNGIYVPHHYATNPDGLKSNNWSSRGNVNPYTGRVGTKDPIGTNAIRGAADTGSSRASTTRTRQASKINSAGAAPVDATTETERLQNEQSLQAFGRAAAATIGPRESTPCVIKPVMSDADLALCRSR